MPIETTWDPHKREDAAPVVEKHKRTHFIGKCPVCDGKRGRVIAVIVQEREIHGYPYTYKRYTHRVWTSKGYKRKYCYSKRGDLGFP